ncbi:Tetracycline resistance protein, class B [Echinococcus granulosus]|nr:Tetracycline resistance protein, class B [Echinococcus granulosus]
MSIGPRRFIAREVPTWRMGCLTTPSVYHAAVVIFLEFFAFGLLTSPMISVLDEAFPKHTFLMNGLIQGVKGFLSFLSAPLIGALSDIFGRKPFLFLTVTFTCSPIPFIKLSHWWYFTMISISGIFSVTFSVILAFVSDVTTVENRTWAYGLVSATFAASLIISPSLGAFLEKAYSESFVITLASLIALSDVLFVLFCVPESLDSCANSSGGGGYGCGSCASCGAVKRISLAAPPSPSSQSVCVNSSEQPTVERSWPITWDKVDPFGALRHISRGRLTLLVCLTTFLSYLPEAGEYSCFFVYLRLVIGFSEENVALFIAICGLFSCIAQTCGLGLLISCLGAKHAIIVGLAFEACQLAMFGFFSSAWILWLAGCVAGLGSITYPALSAFLSNHVKADQQGLTQGLLTGIRGLCGGLGPAVYGFIFFIFQVDLNYRPSNQSLLDGSLASGQNEVLSGENQTFQSQLQLLHRVWTFIPGPPFAFGAFLALSAILVAILIPDNNAYLILPTTAFGTPASTASPANLRHLSHGISSNSESSANLLLACEGEEVEGFGVSNQEAECPSSNSHFIVFASNTTDRRRRLRDNRHHRQPSASKIPRTQPTPPPTTTAQTFFQAHTKLANPLLRMISSGFRQRPNSFRPQSTIATSSSNFFGDLQTRETEAADLANFRVPCRISEGVTGGGGGNEPEAFSLPQSSNFAPSGGDSASHHGAHTHSPSPQSM